MAAGLLQDAAAKAGIGLEVQSAGLAAFPGVPYAAEALEARREVGGARSGGVSQPLSKALVMESDLLLTMTVEHRDAILRKMPMLEGKVFLLSDYAGEGEVAVTDPVGQPLDQYRRTRDQLSGYIAKIVPRLGA